MSTLIRTLAALATLALSLVPALAAEPCRSESFEDARYTVCSFDPRQAAVRVFWRDNEGEPYRTFGRLSEALAGQGLALQFGMNGGMYADDLSPIGLLVENGEQLHPANTRTVSGDAGPIPNFYRKPNGIVLFQSGAARVMTTEAYLQERPAAEFATQSGPMLVIDGAIHPAFIPGSSDRKPRNGVGVAADGTLHFAITEGRVNFHDFARLFRDLLGCPNALFLDGGSAPGLFSPALGRDDPPGHGGYGPIIGAVTPAN